MQKTLLDWTQKTKKVELFRINYCYSKAWFGPFAFQGSLIVSYFGFAVLIWIIVDFASLFTSSEKKRIEHTFFVFLLCEPFYSCHYASLRWSFPKLSLNLYRSCKAKMWLKRNFKLYMALIEMSNIKSILYILLYTYFIYIFTVILYMYQFVTMSSKLCPFSRYWSSKKLT